MKHFRILLLLSVSLCLCGEFVHAAEPAKTLLLLGQKPDGHPPGTHEYLPGQRILQHLLRDIPGLNVELVQADDPWSEGPALLEKADGVVLFVSQGARWIQADPRRYEAFARLAQRGGGLTALHWGTGTKQAADVPGFTRLFGACHGGPDRKYTFFEEIELDAAPHATHPAIVGWKPLVLKEEFYYRLKRPAESAGTVTPLLTIPADDGRQMVCWSFDRTDGGRSFGFSGLHFHENWGRPEYRSLIARGVLWTMQLAPHAEWELDVPAELLQLSK